MGVGEGVRVIGMVVGVKDCVSGVRCETEGPVWRDEVTGSTRCRREEDCDKI